MAKPSKESIIRLVISIASAVGGALLEFFRAGSSVQ